VDRVGRLIQEARALSQCLSELARLSRNVLNYGGQQHELALRDFLDRYGAVFPIMLERKRSKAEKERDRTMKAMKRELVQRRAGTIVKYPTE
jgi:hypothetical protein